MCLCSPCKGRPGVLEDNVTTAEIPIEINIEYLTCVHKLRKNQQPLNSFFKIVHND